MTTRANRGASHDPGDLEVFVGNHQIATRAHELYHAASDVRCPGGADAPRRDLEQAAKASDQIALDLWDDIGIELGCALTNTIWLLNPDVIVIGGGVAKAGDLLFQPIIRTIRQRTVALIHQNLRIDARRLLGNEAGIIGNATLAWEAAGT